MFYTDFYHTFFDANRIVQTLINRDHLLSKKFRKKKAQFKFKLGFFMKIKKIVR